MSTLDDIAIFAAVVREGGFSHAARALNLSNALISRRISQLEKKLGVTLLMRTTRQIHLTPEGELLWQHAKRIQQELDTALALLDSKTESTAGVIRVSGPLFYGQRYLMPIIINFMQNFPNIQVDLILTNQRLDPIKENLDLIIRGAGYFDANLSDSNMKATLLLKQKINLYASVEYLIKYGEPRFPEELIHHRVSGLIEKIKANSEEVWEYTYKNKQQQVTLKPIFNCNDTEGRLRMTAAGECISKLPEIIVTSEMAKRVRPILTDYAWGDFTLYAVYAQQTAMAKRTRMLLDFIIAQSRQVLL